MTYEELLTEAIPSLNRELSVSLGKESLNHPPDLSGEGALRLMYKSTSLHLAGYNRKITTRCCMAVIYQPSKDLRAKTVKLKLGRRITKFNEHRPKLQL